MIAMASQEQGYYVGIDVGTGSARACLIDHTGEILSVASEPIALWQPQTGYYEQSTTDIWRAICICVKGCLTESQVKPEFVLGIGFDATCSLAVFSVDQDEPVAVTGPHFDNSDGNDRNVVLWLDHRPEKETEKINSTKHNLLRYVGGSMSIEMEVPKILWLKNNMPNDLFSNCKFYDLADALTHIATGEETRSFCSTVCKQGYIPVGVDGSVKGWQQDFLETIGLGELCKDNFKQIGGVNGVNGQYLTAGEYVGPLSEKAANMLGLRPGIAVGSGVIDAYAGWIGTVGASDSGPANVEKAFTRLAAVAGTSTCHLVMSKKPVFVNGVWGPYRDVVLSEYWLNEGGQSATGELIKHIIETHPAHGEAQTIAKDFNSNIYDYLNSHLKSMAENQNVPNASYVGRHLFFYGDLFGNRSPIADPNMKGSIAGISSDKSVDSLALLYYGALEFIALQTKQIVERMNESGHHIESIYMSGSLCQNDLLMELMSTACNMPICIPKYIHAAVVHGAAMLGVKAASRADGKEEDLWSIMSRMSKPGSIVHPSKDELLKALLSAKYKVFLEQCESQQRWRKEVDDAIQEGQGK